MAKPIPMNPAGLRRRHQRTVTTVIPPLRADFQVPHASPATATRDRPRLIGQFVLLVSGLTGGMTVVSSLGLWPELSATELGISDQVAFRLLVIGVYLLATTAYAAWKTRLLNDLNQAPWDARLMAYFNLAAGGLTTLTLATIVLLIVAVFIALAGLGVFLIGRATDRSQD